MINCRNAVKRLFALQLLPGAGAVEVELARQIESFGEKCAGLEQYSIKKFAHALEALPKQIAENAGLDVSEMVVEISSINQSLPTCNLSLV